MGKGSPDNHQNKNRDREPALLVERQTVHLQQCSRVVPARLLPGLTADAVLPLPMPDTVRSCFSSLTPLTLEIVTGYS